jgi:hypothetical protein
LIGNQDGNARKRARGPINELETRAGTISRFIGLEAPAHDVLPRAPVALEPRERGRFDQAQLIEPIAVNVLNPARVIFLVNA